MRGVWSYAATRDHPTCRRRAPLCAAARGLLPLAFCVLLAPASCRALRFAPGSLVRSEPGSSGPPGTPAAGGGGPRRPVVVGGGPGARGLRPPCTGHPWPCRATGRIVRPAPAPTPDPGPCGPAPASERLVGCPRVDGVVACFHPTVCRTLSLMAKRPKKTKQPVGTYCPRCGTLTRPLAESPASTVAFCSTGEATVIIRKPGFAGLPTSEEECADGTDHPRTVRH